MAEPTDRDLTAAELEQLVRDLMAQPERWRQLVAHDPERRCYELLLRDDRVAIWVICWMDDHDTGFHDHDLSSGAVPAVTIHAYSPPLWRMGAYEVGERGELRRHSVSYAEELRPLSV
jgi:predicted metal-dependent enzyme (double-stranded beta helix superfamily)